MLDLLKLSTYRVASFRLVAPILVGLRVLGLEHS